jgi:hypothetical protein
LSVKYWNVAKDGQPPALIALLLVAAKHAPKGIARMMRIDARMNFMM